MTYNSSFQDRAAQAAEARQKALEQYRARPPVDEKLAAERKAAGEERAAAKAEKAAEKKAERKARGGGVGGGRRGQGGRGGAEERGRAQGGEGCAVCGAEEAEVGCGDGG